MRESAVIVKVERIVGHMGRRLGEVEISRAHSLIELAPGFERMKMAYVVLAGEPVDGFQDMGRFQSTLEAATGSK